MKKYFIYLSFVLILTSCVGLKVKSYVQYQKNEKVKTIALFPVLIGKIQQPVLPLIDAAIFNGKTEKIAADIMDYQQKNADNLREEIALTLEKYFNCDVLYSETLHEIESYDKLKRKYHNSETLYIDDDDFPMVIISKGDFNPYVLKNGSPFEYFSLPDNYQHVIVELCKELNVDAISVSFSNLEVIDVGMFGLNGKIRLKTYLYVFDKNATIIAKGLAFSEPININGKLLVDYQMAWGDFSHIFNLLAKDLIGENK